MNGTVTRYVEVRDRHWKCVLDISTGIYSCHPVGHEYVVVKVLNQPGNANALATELLQYENYL